MAEGEKKEKWRGSGAKVPRTPMPHQPPGERIHNFDEVPLGYTEEMARIEAQRCLQCKKNNCVEGCPVGIDIKGFIRHIAEGNFEDAIRTMKQYNLLPAVCGRVCPQEEQCEAFCVLKKKYEPVAIGRLERFIADWERQSGKTVVPECKLPTGKKVAVVGAGPAGLTVACDCARNGHQVIVFEALHAPGGVLMYGIPAFRLPKDIVNSEVSLLEKLGVAIRYNVVIGRTFTMDDLRRDFDAVFLGTGAGLPYFMGIEGESLNGVYSANEYLTRVNLMRANNFPENDTPVAESKNVAVIGGGNVAMDAARTAKRLGAENVYLVYRRSEAEMPARNEEIEHAREEGIDFRLLCNPLRYLAGEDGRVSGAECIQMELGEPDASGRRRPVPMEGSEFVLEVDTVVVSIGNGPNPLITSTTEGLEVSKWGTIVIDKESCATSLPGVFAGGDIAIGAATVILAMGMGRDAAAGIEAYIRDPGVWPPRVPEKVRPGMEAAEK
jgi:glutamate synthase (NADPH/NADH) small chain